MIREGSIINLIHKQGPREWLAPVRRFFVGNVQAERHFV